jgi:hypothetical protein
MIGLLCFVLFVVSLIVLPRLLPVVPVAEQVAGLQDHITRWTAGGQLLHAHLFTNNITPSIYNELADFTEVTVLEFPGYAPLAITPSGTVFMTPLPAAVQIFSDPVFQPSGALSGPVTVYGYFVTLHPLTGADTLLYSVKFTTPVIVQFATDAVALDPDIQQGPFTSPSDQ